MRNLSCSIVLCLFSFVGFAQSSSDGSYSGALGRGALSYIQPNDFGAQNKVDFSGEIYLNNDFKEVKIKDLNSGLSESHFVRYNALRGKIEIKLDRSSENFRYMPEVSNLEYDFGDFSLVFKDIVLESGEKFKGYFIKYYSENNIAFYARPFVEMFKRGNRYMNPDEYNYYDLKLNYKFFIEKEGEISSVKLKSNNMQKYFGDKVKMENYFNNRKIKDSNDVVDMLNYYASN